MNRRLFVAALSGCLFPAASCKRSARPITIGSREFTEQRILSEIIDQHLQRRLGDPVKRRTGFENTQLIHQALMLHDIDLYVEYSGAEVSVVLGEAPDPNPDVVLERVRRSVEQTRTAAWLNPLGIENPFAVSIPGPLARQNKIATLEDAANYAPGWVISTSSEFQRRRDGYGALLQKYNLRIRGVPVVQDAGSLYVPVEQNRADMIAGRLTDGILALKDLTVLKDVRSAFASCLACITVRNDTLAAYPRLRSVLEELSGKFSTELMRKLNAEVDAKRRDPKQVAAEFLQSAGLG